MLPLKSSWYALAGIVLMSKRKIGSLLGRTAFFFCTPHETIENWLPVGLQHFTRPEKGVQASAYLQIFPELEPRGFQATAPGISVVLSTVPPAHRPASHGQPARWVVTLAVTVPMSHSRAAEFLPCCSQAEKGGGLISSRELAPAGLGQSRECRRAMASCSAIDGSVLSVPRSVRVPLGRLPAPCLPSCIQLSAHCERVFAGPYDQGVHVFFSS